MNFSHFMFGDDGKFFGMQWPADVITSIFGQIEHAKDGAPYIVPPDSDSESFFKWGNFIQLAIIIAIIAWALKSVTHKTYN